MANDEEIQGSELPEHPKFSNFEVIEILGQGGMGTVWKVRQKNLARVVALKVLNAGKLARNSELRRFKSEASAAAKLQHPSLVPIYEVGEEQGCSFFTMEYIEGQTLANLLKGTPLPPRRAAELMQMMAEAIDYAHKRGVLHRDLKPENIIVDHSGRPRITDFGLAKELDVKSNLTQSNAILGTPSYMSPEQAEGKTKELSPRSDVYSLGAVLYEMITGRPPFRAHSLNETLQQVIAGSPALPRSVNPKVPRDLETICMKCLQKEPGRRYSSAQDTSEDLRRFLSNEPIRARPVGMAGRAWRILRRNPMVAASLAATALLLVLMAVAAVLARQSILTMNELLAKTTSDLLEMQLRSLATTVNDVSKNPMIIGAMQSTNKLALLGLLQNVHAKVNDARELQWIESKPFDNWNIYDMNGTPLARSPNVPPQDQEVPFNDRDYFIGALQKWTKSGTERVHLSKVHISRVDGDYRFGLSAAIVSHESGGAKPIGTLVAMFTPGSSAPLNNIDSKIALIGPADSSDTNNPPKNFTFLKYRFVLHPAYSTNSSAIVGVNKLPFNPENRTHNFYTDPVASSFPEYGGLWWLAGSAPVNLLGSENTYYVVVQNRDWISNFVGGTFAAALIASIVAIGRRKYAQWQSGRRAAETGA